MRHAWTRCSGSTFSAPGPDDGGKPRETDTDLKDYIANTELAAAPPVVVAAGEIAGAESAEDDLQAAIDAGSVLGFVDGLSGQDKDDVLFSTQFAQRAASAKSDRFLEVQKWYRDYVEWMETLGWVVPQFSFNDFDLDDRELKMDAAALEIIAAVASGGQTAILKKTLEALGGLADDSKQIKLFDFHSSVQFGGNFQMGAVQKAENGAVSVALGAFHYKSVDNRKGFLFIRWGKQTVNFWASAQTITLNQTLYAQVRDTVAEALGASAKSLISGVKLPL